MSQQSQGIQTLLEAEKEGAKIVQKARDYRVQKLKEARSQAEQEIKEYKASKDQEFQKFEQSRAGTTQTSQVAIDKETEEKLKNIDTAFQKNKDKVLKMISDRVMLVNVELHRNLKKVES
ncbi:V-type ATPase [Schizopora paradoxa]|uniref:V-type proton ATPase subunit G n=1 Tax=Schizopora paradoxa TaxID=27342 RepID=A0A0H2S485_9AGAM|nr:V-type ATPase [Schizopora paradoxa]